MENMTYEPLPENLNQPATKGDVVHLATKSELQAEIKILCQEMNARFNELPTKADYHQLLNTMDDIVKEMRGYNQERAVESHRLERLEKHAKAVGKAVQIEFET